MNEDDTTLTINTLRHGGMKWIGQWQRRLAQSRYDSGYQLAARLLLQRAYTPEEIQRIARDAFDSNEFDQGLAAAANDFTRSLEPRS